MAFPLLPGFKRRSYLNGKTVSFCTGCYAVVADTSNSRELNRLENAHACDPRLVQYWQALVKDISREQRAALNSR